MSAAQPLDYAGRCERYARQRGWAHDPARLSIGHLTPRQRKRAIKKERSAWPLYSRRSVDMPWDPRYYPDDASAEFDEEIIADLQDKHNALVTDFERRFLGDLENWKPTGLMQP